MKTVMTALTLSISLVTLSAQANFVDSNNQMSISTVKETLSMKDDSYVKLQGNIVKQLNSEDYIFRDTTNETEVEIDKEVFRNQTVTPENTVVIIGEVDNDKDTITVDVDRLELI